MPVNLTLTGTVTDQATGKSIGNVEVEIWPTQQDATVPLTTAVTDSTGQFVIQLTIESSGLAQSIRFRILKDGKLLEIDQANVNWGGRGTRRTVTIPVIDATATLDAAGGC